MDKICFIHIEKAGGSTLHNWFKYYMPNYLSLDPYYTWTNEKDSEFSNRELEILKMFHPMISGFGGHRLRSYLCYEDLFNQNLKYITFLRNPIARYLSHFQHQNEMMKNERSLNEFLNERRFNNFMCVKICGKQDGVLAFKQLKKMFSFVGFVEDFNKSLLLLCNEFSNHSIQPYYEKKNEGNRNMKINFDKLDENFQFKIEQNNREDIILYKLAKDYFSNIYDINYKGNINEDLKIFEKKLQFFRYKILRKKIIRIIKGYNHFITEPISRKLVQNE